MLWLHVLLQHRLDAGIDQPTAGRDELLLYLSDSSEQHSYIYILDGSRPRPQLRDVQERLSLLAFKEDSQRAPLGRVLTAERSLRGVGV